MDALLQQAYHVTMSSIERARDLGIQVDIKECVSRNNTEMVSQWNTPDRLPPDKWVNVTFNIVNQNQANLIYAMLHELSSVGIMFDSGGGTGKRDWELDWSFHLGSTENIERHNILVEVEELIKKMEVVEKQLH